MVVALMTCLYARTGSAPHSTAPVAWGPRVVAGGVRA